MDTKNSKNLVAPTCDCDVINEEIVDEVLSKLPEASVSVDLANLFKLFADATRIRLLQCLLVHEMCVCDLAVALGVTKSAVSHHLRALKLANIVRFRREGQMVFYALADEHVEKIVSQGLDHILE